MNNVIKRDGEVVPFEASKIENAILKAFIEVDSELSSYATEKAKNISAYIGAMDVDSLGVEEIQDLVEKGLMATKRKDVARAYIVYRDERTRIRNRNTRLMRSIGEKLKASNVKNQNANVDEHSFGGRKGEAANVMMKQYALDNCMSDMARTNHLNNEIYIHDLDSYAIGMHNCLSVPFDDLLANGFNTRQTDIRPASSVNTAFQLVAVIFQLQSLQQFGGVSATHLDWTMVPYVRKSFWKHFKDGMTYIGKINMNIEDMPDNSERSIIDPTYTSCEEVYKYAMDMTQRELAQAVEGLYHNLNTLQSRSGNQLN